MTFIGGGEGMGRRVDNNNSFDDLGDIKHSEIGSTGPLYN